MASKFSDAALNDALEKGISEGLFPRLTDEAAKAQLLESLSAILSAAYATERRLAEEREEARSNPIKVEDTASIPFAKDEIVYLESRDQPDQTVARRIFRGEYGEPQAVCFIGRPPEIAKEMIIVGHNVYELPDRFILESGSRLIKAHRSSEGTRWIEVPVGETSNKLNGS